MELTIHDEAQKIDEIDLLGCCYSYYLSTAETLLDDE